MKVLLVVLAVSFAVPRLALATGEFPPFTQLVDDLADAIDQVIEETDMVIGMFGDDAKVVRHLEKGKGALVTARGLIELDVVQKGDPTEFPKNLKKVAGLLKKWSKSMDKAAKASSTKVPAGTIPKYEKLIDSRLLIYLNAWFVLIIVAMLALINTAMSMSQSWPDDFTPKLDKKLVQTQVKIAAGLLLFGMSGGSFVPLAFLFALGSTKKGFGLLAASLKISIILMLFIASFQSQTSR
jgi:hypothetical protein